MTPLREEALRLLRLARRDRDTFDLLFPLPKANLAALGQALLDEGEALPLSIDQLRSLNPFAVEYRYDDELIPKTSREALAEVLATVTDWADKRVSP